MHVMVDLDDQAIFECVIEVLSLSDKELKAKLKEFIDGAASHIYFVRKLEETTNTKLPSTNEKIALALARMTLLLENL